MLDELLLCPLDELLLELLLLEDELCPDDEELDELELCPDEELDELELCPLDEELDELELCPDEELLDELEDELEELCPLDADDVLDVTDELDEERSSIDRMRNKPSAGLTAGPGNCNDPVWKLRIVGADASPDVLVSTNFAWNSVLSGRTIVASSTVPANDWLFVGVSGKLSSPAPGMRVIVTTRVVKPTAGPR